MKPSLVAAVVIPLGLASALARADVTGAYEGTWGATTLGQDGTRVAGAYTYDDGRIDGELDGDSATSGGAWVLSPSASAIASVGRKDGAWTWGLRIPWDTQFTPHNISMGVIGVTLDVGKHLASSRWYLGGSAEYELEVDMMPPDSSSASADTPAVFNRLRAGGEARYYVGDGIASVSVNDGPEIPVPRHDWIGVRAGAESFDGFSHVGNFADLTYAWDADLGGTAIGMTLTAGVSFEPSSVFPGNAENDPSAQPLVLGGSAAAPSSTPATYVSPYLAMGIHLQF